MNYLTRAATSRIVECLGVEREEWRADFAPRWIDPASTAQLYVCAGR